MEPEPGAPLGQLDRPPLRLHARLLLLRWPRALGWPRADALEEPPLAEHPLDGLRERLLPARLRHLLRARPEEPRLLPLPLPSVQAPELLQLALPDA